MTIKFEISKDNIIEFADILRENEMENSILGTTEDDTLLVEVNYTRDQRDIISDLEDLAENE